jgi:hypothetical protein
MLFFEVSMVASQLLLPELLELGRPFAELPPSMAASIWWKTTRLKTSSLRLEFSPMAHVTGKSDMEVKDKDDTLRFWASRMTDNALAHHVEMLKNKPQSKSRLEREAILFEVVKRLEGRVEVSSIWHGDEALIR